MNDQWIAFREAIPQSIVKWAEKRQGSRLYSACGCHSEPGIWHFDFETGDGFTVNWDKLPAE